MLLCTAFKISRNMADIKYILKVKKHINIWL